MKKSSSIPTEQNPNKNPSKKLLAELEKRRAEETDQIFKNYIRNNKIVKFVGRENPE